MDISKTKLSNSIFYISKGYQIINGIFWDLGEWLQYQNGLQTGSFGFNRMGEGLIGIWGLKHSSSDSLSELVLKMDTFNEYSFAGVEDGRKGLSGALLQDESGGEWNRRFEGDRFGELDLLKGVFCSAESVRLDLEEMEAGLLEAAVAAGMAGGKGWCTGVVEVLKW